jgi:hypothetical protein
LLDAPCKSWHQFNILRNRFRQALSTDYCWDETPSSALGRALKQIVRPRNHFRFEAHPAPAVMRVPACCWRRPTSSATRRL